MVLAASCSVAPCHGAPTGDIQFGRDIYPVLQRSCIECHGPKRQEGELRLDERERALQGGVSGPVIVPGKPAESELLRRINLPKGHAEIMPALGQPLSKRQIELVRTWIAAGAVWPEKHDVGTHWSFVSPVRAALPKVQPTTWPRNAIDHFILARLEEESLRPSAEAERATLIRRLSLDLIGIPPSPAEVDAFLADTGDDAYEKLVDRLLASPQFGERWARPWLDLARYADSHGFQRDDLRQLWPYRDWVIQALNSDMPFDRFTLEQIAGDLLPEATEAQRIATGFHRCTTMNVEAGSDPEETRINQVMDRVNTTAAVWLGATLECAQCHDHKFDPFTQRDYYRLLAFFNNTSLEADRSNPKVPGSIRFLGPNMTLADSAAESLEQQRKTELRQIEKALAERKVELSKDQAAWEASFATDLGRKAETHVLEISAFASEEGCPHKLLEDHSVLLVDDAPDKDTYTITVETRLPNITGFKLEALLDPSLPGKGPGRGDPERPNFVLNTLAVTAAPLDKDGKPLPLKLTARDASFEQTRFPLSGAVDASPKTAWAIASKFHEAHWAIVETERPIGDAEGTRLTFTLVQEFGGGRTIGRVRLSALTGRGNGKPIPDDVLAALKKPAAKRSAKEIERLLDFRLEQDDNSRELRAKREQAEAALHKLTRTTTLVMQEVSEKRETSIFARGDFRTPGESVEPGVPAILHKLPDGTPDRIMLARWLTDRNNPLVARVAVNRWWAELFGQGIVATLEDFGIKGEPPTHPELLDWLAVEFMDNGWSMKRLLRTIVTSATYRQSSKVTPELLVLDDRNLLYARGPRFRLDAETVRDNALAASGLLSLKSGGPPIRPYQPDGLWTKVGGEKVDYIVSPGQEKHRRGIYVVWKRASPYPSFMNFDASQRLACTVRRSRSNTPLQALTLLNDPVYVEAAGALAQRVLREQNDASPADRLRYAFRLCLARPASESEVAVLNRLYVEQLAAAQADPQSAKKLTSQFATTTDQSPAELAAWYAVASALLNLDETITKN